ncbi:MAG: hypothetical protein WCK17_04550 [Verrucomicrobiota bacterium]
MNFLKRCWQKRWLRRLTWTVVTLTALIASLYAWVNASGARQLRKVEAMLKAEGETLDFRETMNEPVPEAENFCAIPLLKDLALVVDNDASKGAPGEKRKRLDRASLKRTTKDFGGQRSPRRGDSAESYRTDLKGWADWMRKDGSFPMTTDSGDAARDLLAGLAELDEIVQELASGFCRPKAQWTPEWKTRELSATHFSDPNAHYSTIVAMYRTLALRIAAAAQTGEATKAHQDALVMVRFNQANLNEPLTIGLVIGITGVSFLQNSVWELCITHTGTSEDFAKIESALLGHDIRRAALRAFRSQIAANVYDIQCCKQNPENFWSVGIGTQRDDVPKKHKTISLLAYRTIPLGFLDKSAALLAEEEFKYFIKPLRDQGWREVYQTSRKWEDRLVEIKKTAKTNLTYFLLAQTSGFFPSLIKNCVYQHALLNQAIIACALERHRIEKGSYPDSLDAVRLADGKPLPLDPINEKPMGYHKTSDGRYALWSVGFDGKDDGGKRSLNEIKSQKTFFKPQRTHFNSNDYLGDWVWDFPAE